MSAILNILLLYIAKVIKYQTGYKYIEIQRLADRSQLTEAILIIRSADIALVKELIKDYLRSRHWRRGYFEIIYYSFKYKMLPHRVIAQFIVDDIAKNILNSEFDKEYFKNGLKFGIITMYNDI